MEDRRTTIFDKQYRFYGRHAQFVTDLISLLDKDNKISIFKYNIDVLLVAPLVGFLYGRTAERSNDKDETGKVLDTSVFGDKIIESQQDFRFNYWLITLLDKEYEPDANKRISKAFREDPSAEDEERFNSFIRGGVEVLHEKIIGDDTSMEDIVNNLSVFIQDFQERFRTEEPCDMSVLNN